ncbi:hypothetical protein PHISCL_08381 [Aspergillus sclerotialis]|uniref:Ell binding protein Ebp1 C-terminal domain-containing protein n=1 Tax=Aspergillus sclerotialis TaxID=2070753 RepID=A0A3A2ZD92_9EURO|nr:hypothetical protein PHISCL_08381 [Aspergillus sclerotialis]
MSVKQSPSFANHGIRNPQCSRKELSAQEPGLIDQRLKQLKEEVLPFYPFLLTVPTDVPFRLGSRFVNNWAVGKEGPFTPEEQQLQYLTFLTHHEGDSLLVAVGDWSDEPGKAIMDPSRAQNSVRTPSSGLVKKRISLNDYKTKRNNGTSALAAGQDVPGRADHKQHALKMSCAEKNNSPKQVDTISSTRSPIQANARRKHLSESPRERSSSPKEMHSEMPSKRQRLSPEISRSKPTHSKSSKLPTLLSPTLPPASRSPRLPRLLSPTLPPDIEKELSRPDEELSVFDLSQTRSFSHSVFSEGLASKAKSPSHDSAPSDVRGANVQSSHAQPQGGADKDSSTGLDYASTVYHETFGADVLHRKANTSQQLGSNLIPGTNMSSANPRENHHAPPSKPRLILKLKYGRSNRKRVEALLKFSGKRRVTQPSSAQDRDNHEPLHIKREEQGMPRLSMSDERKINHVENYRATSQPKERPKELRASTSEKQAQTPASVPEISTAVQPQYDKAKQIPTTVLPKDHRGRTPRQTELTDEKTPVSPALKSSSRDTGAISKSSPPSDQKPRHDWERRAWKDEFHRFGNLGRELKHAADRHMAKEGDSAVDQKLAVATAIEAIFCFILAFVADDQSKALARQVGESSNWLSILAYWRVVKKNSTPYPALYSLCHILGAVSYDAIHALDLERLAISPIPGEHNAGPAASSDRDIIVPDEGNRAMKEFLELKNRLPESFKESRRLWLEGTRRLSEDVLASEYPVTWSKRSRNYSERGRQQVKVGDYSGDFFLPLERTSLPLEIVRFGWSMLTEWCTKEGVGWKGRLNL